MAGSANSNAGLMRRIVQLEAEKNELQQDVEALCMQQSGFSGNNDVVSRMQARRTAGLEQELEAFKLKLALHTKESLRLQEELAESFRAKGRVADRFKEAMDKNIELEKEVKFYQSRMAGAFTERDKAVLEVERLRATEVAMTKEMRELHHRLDQLHAKSCEREKSYAELQQSVDVPTSELRRVQKVVEKFWMVRETGKEHGHLYQDSLDKVQVLLEDDDADWTYLDESVVNSCKAAEHALTQVKEEFSLSKDAATKLEEELFLSKSVATNLVNELALMKSAVAKLNEELSSSKTGARTLEEDLKCTEAASTDLKHQPEEECVGPKNAEENCLITSNQLASSKLSVERELQRLRAQQLTLRTMMFEFLEAEKSQLSSLGENVQDVLNRVKSEAVQVAEMNRNLPRNLERVARDRKSLRVHFEDEGTGQLTTVSKDENTTEPQKIATAMGDDSSQVLAQALQEKVEALLLLSQQEERYYLEASTQSILESQVTALNQKLAQVTGEKVRTLMELAEERQRLQVLQDRDREIVLWLKQQNVPFPFKETVPVLCGPEETSSSQAIEDKTAGRTKQLLTASRGYFKSWLGGLDTASYRTTSSITPRADGDDLPSDKGHNDVDSARLLLENTALQESIASIQRLANSASRLRRELVKATADLKSEISAASIQAAIEVMESVKSEAKQLTVVPGCTLPISFQGSLEKGPKRLSVEPSSEERFSEGNDGEDTECSPHLDSVSLTGLEVSKLLLTLADLQIESLQARLHLASSD